MNLHKLHFINTRVSSREFDTRALVSLTVHSVRTRVPRVQSWQRSTKCISKVAWCWQTYDTAVEVESLGGWMSVVDLLQELDVQDQGQEQGLQFCP